MTFKIKFFWNCPVNVFSSMAKAGLSFFLSFLSFDLKVLCVDFDHNIFIFVKLLFQRLRNNSNTQKESS